MTLLEPVRDMRYFDLAVIEALNLYKKMRDDWNITDVRYNLLVSDLLRQHNELLLRATKSYNNQIDLSTFGVIDMVKLIVRKMFS